MVTTLTAPIPTVEDTDLPMVDLDTLPTQEEEAFWQVIGGLALVLGYVAVCRASGGRPVITRWRWLYVLACV